MTYFEPADTAVLKKLGINIGALIVVSFTLIAIVVAVT